MLKNNLEGNNFLILRNFLFSISLISGKAFGRNTVAASSAFVRTNAYFALQNACWKAQTLSVLYRSGAGLVTESLKVTKFQQ